MTGFGWPSYWPHDDDDTPDPVANDHAEKGRLRHDHRDDPHPAGCRCGSRSCDDAPDEGDW